MAMLPFIGYNAGDYIGHWIEMGKHNDAVKLPKIFYVNWFRRDDEGNFLWPGFRENMRVLKWAIERAEGTAAAEDTVIGRVPTLESLDLDGLDADQADVAAALTVNPDEWRDELAGIEEWFAKIGQRLPSSMHDELDALRQRVNG
jgi:phosphoenolpyruvate carboxykinase (GTP)